MLYIIDFYSPNIVVEAEPKKMKAVLAQYRRQYRRWMDTDELSSACSKKVKQWHKEFRPAVTSPTGFKAWLRQEGVKIRTARHIERLH